MRKKEIKKTPLGTERHSREERDESEQSQYIEESGIVEKN